MAKKSKKPRLPASGDVVTNRRARHKFEWVEKMEAGIVLRGSEVKALRGGKAQMTNAAETTAIVDLVKAAQLVVSSVERKERRKFAPPPFIPKFGGKKWPDFRRVAVQFQGPDHLYHLIITGPSATVEHYKKGFDEWLKGFKK